MKTCTMLRRQDGGSAVEFAIVLPLFFLIVFGIVEWSLYLYNSHVITNASRAGARRGIISAVPKISESEIQQEVLHYSEENLVTLGTQTPPDVTVNVYKPDGTVEYNADGTVAKNCVVFQDGLEVTASYNYTFLLLPSLSFGQQSPLVKEIIARTVMKCE